MKTVFASISRMLAVTGLVLLTCVFNGSPCCAAESKSTAIPNKKPEAVIRGQVVDPGGKGVSGVSVRCWDFANENFPRERWRVHTDTSGQYQFTVPALLTCRIEAGGFVGTYTQSKKFDVKLNEICQVDELIIRPANNSCKGRMVFENGRPAANLSYGYVSNSFSPTDPENQPKTNDKGQFVIEHILPDELFSFWAFPKKNTLCVWRRLDPNSKNLEFTLKASEYIQLPEDWLRGGRTHEAIARDMTFAKDSKIQFSLPDLRGNKISLQDQQFKNKPVLVNIGGSWCGGCRLEIPYLVDFKNKYQKQGLEIIGIAFERGSKEEQLETVGKTAQEFEVNYPLLIGGSTDKKNVATVIKGLELFGGYPTTLYIDRNGLVKHIQTGFWIHSGPHKQWQLRQMENHIKSLLGK
ncbi:MAG: redoxin domain-containing protein [Planctomycetota bacterium]|jgi:thiol-disulfide isomerase/thioredoxin